MRDRARNYDLSKRSSQGICSKKRALGSHVASRAEAYALLARNRKKHDTQLIAMSMEDIDRELLFHEDVRIAALKIFTVDKAEAARKETKAKLPANYHDFLNVFDRSKADELSPHRECDHKIELNEGQSSPPKSKAYKMSFFKLIKVKEYLTKMLSKEFIILSKAPYFSPILFALKSNRDLRFCVDYRKLNALTKRNRYPLPLIDEVIGKLRGCKFLTRLDIIAAFNKIRMHRNSEDLTTFITALGQYKYRVLSFDLTNDPSIFQQYVNEVLWENLNIFCQAYLNDILVYSKTRKEYRQYVR